MLQFRRPPRRDLIAAGRLHRKLSDRFDIRTEWIGEASCGVVIGRRAFVIDYTGQLHPDWWGTRRLEMMTGGGA